MSRSTLLPRFLGLSLFSAIAAAGQSSSLYEIPLKTLRGRSTTLAPYKGKVLLVVNTASECGYTPQYEGLQKLHEKHEPEGLVVLGFPSNDFGGQEPGSSEQIQKFCQLNYGVKFPLFSKGPVSGSDKQPLYAWLVKNMAKGTEPRWNFTKYLVSRKGEVLAKFESSVAPDSDELKKAIQAALAVKGEPEARHH